MNDNSFLKRIKQGVSGAGESAKNKISAWQGKSKRNKMVDEAVAREVRKRYPTGLAGSPQNKPIYDKIKKEIINRITKKNPNLLK